MGQFQINKLLASPSLAKCAEDALCRLSDSCSQTLEVGRRLCDGVAEPESRRDLQSELQAVQEAWERGALLLQQRRDLEHTAVKVAATHRPITSYLFSLLCFFSVQTKF